MDNASCREPVSCTWREEGLHSVKTFHQVQWGCKEVIRAVVCCVFDKYMHAVIKYVYFKSCLMVDCP